MTEKTVAVITGAASGIGFALACECLKAGMNVVIADIAKVVLQEKIAQLQLLTTDSTTVVGIVCDVSKRADIEHLAKRTYDDFGQVDLLINNAGISGPLAPLWELSGEQVYQVMDVNLYGVLNGIQVFLPRMLKQPARSHIVNMASFYGLCSGSQMGAYAMSKHAIVALTESLYFDLRRLDKPMDVSVVCPSFANTNLIHNSATIDTGALNSVVGELMGRARPAADVASSILREIHKKTFYILPDKEVKEYCIQRTHAIVNETAPHQHSIEKVITALSRRL